MGMFSKYLLSLLVLMSCFSLKSQVPIGEDIIGPQSGVQLGWATDMNADGTRFVVSSPLYDLNIFDEGFTQVYELVDGDWVQMGDDIYGLSSHEQSGYRVAINDSGTRILIASHRGSINGTHQGHCRVFEWNGTSWQQMGATIFGESSQNYSGSSISMNALGDRIVIASPGNSNNGSQAGQIRIFEWSGSDWVQMGLSIHGDNEGDILGAGVSMNSDGNRLVVSAVGHDTTEDSAGQIKVFEWSGSDWVQIGDDIYGQFEDYALGSVVDINNDGTRIVASAVAGFSTSTSIWRTHVYNWDGSQWIQLGNDLVYGEVGDNFGFALSFDGSGDRLAIGGYHSDDNGMDSGVVRVFDYNGTDWDQHFGDISGSEYDLFGYSVSLNDDGTRLAVGARGFDGGTGIGQLRVHDLTILGITDKDGLKNKIYVYPNPVENYITINNLQNLQITTGFLYDASGKLIQEFDFNSQDNLIQLNISNLSLGFYTLTVKTDSGKINFKLIKQ